MYSHNIFDALPPLHPSQARRHGGCVGSVRTPNKSVAGFLEGVTFGTRASEASEHEGGPGLWENEI